MADTIKKMVCVTTTEEEFVNLLSNMELFRDQIDKDKLLKGTFLSKSALCHALFVKFNEDPGETINFLNLNK